MFPRVLELLVLTSCYYRNFPQIIPVPSECLLLTFNDIEMYSYVSFLF